MIESRSSIGAALSVAFACSAFSSHCAAADTSLAETRWEEVVVIGSHVPRPAREVGSAVTVFGAEDIAARKVALGSELLREVPGVAVSRSGQVGNLTQVRIRGAEGNHTLVLVDGIEVNDPAFGSEFDFANLLTYDLGRVEVLRGPQSALYGSDAIGGVVSLTTRRPEPGLAARAEAVAGSFGTTQLGATLGGGADRLSGAVSAVRYDSDGISASAIHPEKDGYENATLHARLDAALTPQVAARAVLRQVDNRVETDREDFAFPPGPTEGLIIDTDDVKESSQLYGLLALDAELLDGRWLHRAAYGFTRAETDVIEDRREVSASRGERRKLEYSTTLRLGGRDVEHALTAGVQHEALDFSNRSVSLPAANQRREDEQTSLVAEYALSLAGRAAVSASLRRDYNDLFDDATTARVTGSYLLASGTRVHASFGEGITNPGFYELFGFIPDSFRGNPDLEPERSVSWDAGVEQSLLQGRLLVDATYFRADLEDEIATVFDFATFSSTVVNQRGESERQGVEVTVEAELHPRWSLFGTYTHLDATEPDGSREVRRPRHAASLNLDARFLDGRARLNIGVLFNGARDDLEFVSATPESRVRLERYTLVNGALSYDVDERVQIFLRGENLLDEEYTEVFGYRTPGAAGYLGVRARL